MYTSTNILRIYYATGADVDCFSFKIVFANFLCYTKLFVDTAQCPVDMALEPRTPF